MQFNDAQSQAITHVDGPMMVLAGPGSGKTMVITHRVKHLITQARIPASRILVVTFTKAAASEMRQRFVSLMQSGDEGSGVTFGTFHAVFFAILKHAYGYNGGNIIRDEEKVRFMKDIIIRMQLDPDNMSELVSELLAEIAYVKGEMLDLSGYYAKSCAADVFRSIYREYARCMTDQRKLDFEDMMVYTYELLTQRPDILKGWQQRYRYILVDEFQDINALQYRLICMLAGPENNLFIVGDDDQSIYGFRGARPELMLGFEKDFPETEKVWLSVNYRSQAAIVEAAGSVIDHNKARFEKDIRALKIAGDPPDVRLFDSPMEENNAIIARIRDYRKRDIPFGEMAVLFRTNTQARMLIEKMMEYNIPFAMQDDMPNIFSHWIAGDLMAYLMIASGERDSESFLRIINRPNRYVSRRAIGNGKVSLRELRDSFSDKDWMVRRIEQLAADLDVIGRMPPGKAIAYILDHVGYGQFLEDYARERRMEPSELMAVAMELKESAKNYLTLQDWQEHIRDYTDKLKEQSQKKGPGDCVSLATMHHSKGLEFMVVFIADANEGITPHQKAVVDSDIEEERRLFYVAMTRAKEYLHVCVLKERYGKSLEMSRFVSEMLVDRRKIRRGIRILHQTYGYGTVLQVTDRMIEVLFDNKKTKRKLNLEYCLTHALLELVQ